MDLNMLFDNYDLLMDSPSSTVKMRKLIMRLAVQGKLVEQDPNDEPASELLKRIKAEKEKLIAEGKIKKQKLLTPITEDEIPYGIPESWTWIRLEEVFYPISVGKKKIKNSEIREKGPCPVIDQGQSYIAGYTDESNKLIKVPGPVIIFGDHTCKLKLINFDFVAGADGVKVLRPIEIYENYFFLVLKALKIENRGYSRHYKYFLNNLLPLPSLAEQKRIVSKVDQWMDLCDQLDACQKKAATKYESLNDAALEKLLSSKTIDEFANHWQFICNNFDFIYNDPAHVNKLRQAILQLAVQGKLAPQDPNDEHAIELLKRIKAEKEKLIAEGKIKKQKPLPPIAEDEILYELPQGWEWARFNQLVNPEYPISYGVLVPGPNIENGVPFVRIGDLDLINPPLRPEKSIDKEIDRKYERTRIVGGEILMGVVGSIGKLGIAPDSWHGANIARAICRIVPSKFIYKHYLIWLLQSELMQNGFIGDTRTLAQPTLNLGLIRAAFTPLPPLSEQKRIVAKVDQLMHLCDELETRLNQSKKDSEMLMQAVLHEAFS